MVPASVSYMEAQEAAEAEILNNVLLEELGSSGRFWPENAQRLV